jgi:hypothetical protein
MRSSTISQAIYNESTARDTRRQISDNPRRPDRSKKRPGARLAWAILSDHPQGWAEASGRASARVMAPALVGMAVLPLSGSAARDGERGAMVESCG